MARIIWDSPGERRYEVGVDHGVFYRHVGGLYTNGVAWNGLTGVSDDAGGRDPTPLYSGDIRVGSEFTAEEYAGKITCYTYPDEFEEYFGEQEMLKGVYARQQQRDLFGFCYRSYVANDVDGVEHGYKLHLLYNLRVTDLERSYSSINDSFDIEDTEISFESYPMDMDFLEMDPVSELVLDSRYVDPDSLNTIENVLYGVVGTPRMPYPEELIELLVTPDDWYLYPYYRVFPASDLYPYSPGE